MDMDNDTSPRSPRHGSERTLLQGFLDSQRGALLRKLDGRGMEQATRQMVSSATTLLGLVKQFMDVEGCCWVMLRSELKRRSEGVVVGG